MAGVEEKGDVFRALMEIQRSLGALSAKTDRLVTDVDLLNAKIDARFDVLNAKFDGKFEAVNVNVDALRLRLAWLTGASAVVAFLFATALALAKFLPLVAAH